jgi:hypothetical protein
MKIFSDILRAGGFFTFGGLRGIQILTIARRPILQQYGRRTIVRRWVTLMAAKSEEATRAQYKWYKRD